MIVTPHMNFFFYNVTVRKDPIESRVALAESGPCAAGKPYFPFE